MPIRIPADLTIVTLRNNGQELPQRWTESYAKSVLENASNLLRDRLDIEFPLGLCERVVEEMPDGASADRIDDAGYHYLAAAHRAGSGVRVILVDRVDRAELGGEARYQTRVCLIAYQSILDPAGRILAHELGHLLQLPHADSGRGGPGHESETAANMRNLMYSGALNPAAEVTQDQIRLARSSTLARRFGG